MYLTGIPISTRKTVANCAEGARVCTGRYRAFDGRWWVIRAAFGGDETFLEVDFLPILQHSRQSQSAGLFCSCSTVDG